MGGTQTNGVGVGTGVAVGIGVGLGAGVISGMAPVPLVTPAEFLVGAVFPPGYWTYVPFDEGSTFQSVLSKQPWACL